jgi:hypothetical protein
MSENIPNLNPRIATLNVGTRELRTIKVYPFSAGQEIEVVDVVAVLINSMAEMQKENTLKDLEVFEMFSKVIKEKATLIIGFVTDPKDEVSLNDFDNHQFTDFVNILIEANFGETIKKKLVEIQERLKILFLSAKSLPKS